MGMILNQFRALEYPMLSLYRISTQSPPAKTKIILQCRHLSIHEYQSMDILEKGGIPTPRGKIATSSEQVYKIAQSFIIKAQVLAGGRGKGIFDNGLRGGVQIVYSPEEARDVAQSMLGHRLITKQTGSAGRPCNSGLVLMGSKQGGMDIEVVATEDPGAIITSPIPLDRDISPREVKNFVTRIGIHRENAEETVGIIMKMIKLVKEKDMTLLEINPLIETADGKIVCLDAKINFDDNAEFRQREIFALRDETQEDPREVMASAHRLNYIGLDGQIGCLVNGAGLAMATMDIIKMHGGEPANFLDVGGGATIEQVEDAIKILGGDGSVKAILVNIFGGIMRCDIVAQGITNAASQTKLKIPIVVRLLGTNMNEAKEIISKSKLKVFACDDLDEAAKKVVLLSKIMDLSKEANVNIRIEDTP